MGDYRELWQDEGESVSWRNFWATFLFVMFLQAVIHLLYPHHCVIERLLDPQPAQETTHD